MSWLPPFSRGAVRVASRAASWAAVPSGDPSHRPRTDTQRSRPTAAVLALEVSGVHHRRLHPSAGMAVGFASLLLGYYDAGGELDCADKVGTGFGGRMLRGLRAVLSRLECSRPAFQRGTRSRSGRIGLARRWRARPRSRKRPKMAISAIPVSRGCAWTRTQRRWCGKCRGAACETARYYPT